MIAAEPRGASERIERGPAPFEPGPQRPGVHPDFRSPLGQGKCTALAGYMPVAASVGALLGASGPTAVIGAVRPVVVYPVERKTFDIAGRHVVDEVLDRAPAFADIDASAPIPVVRGVPGTVAPIYSPVPRAKQRVFSEAVLRLPRGGALPRETTARLAEFVPETVCGNGFAGSTITHTGVHCVPVARYVAEALNQKSAETGPRYVCV